MSPLKLFEYMAHGLPIVSSDLPALREVLENESNALLCDPDDIVAWVSAIERLRSSLQLRLGSCKASPRGLRAPIYLGQASEENPSAALRRQ